VADIGSAIGARYPSLSLTGQIVAPATPGYLLTRTLTAGLVLPLFDQPGLAAAVNVARARADQAYQTWRGTVLQAVEDVETALAQVAGARAAAQAADRAVKLDVEALALSRQLLTGTGSVTVLDVLDREQALTTARATAASARRDEALSAIGLYVALGLGPEAGAETGTKAGTKAGSGQP
jgi:multidrug efflux system outer membrane protein